MTIARLRAPEEVQVLDFVPRDLVALALNRQETDSLEAYKTIVEGNRDLQGLATEYYYYDAGETSTVGLRYDPETAIRQSQDEDLSEELLDDVFASIENAFEL